MTPNEYQIAARKTAIYRDSDVGKDFLQDEWDALSYCALKLNGEAGEVAEHIGKIKRDDGYTITTERSEALFKEIGDVCWYVANLCTELEFKLEDVLDYNLAKLADRQKRNMLQGSGSDR